LLGVYQRPAVISVQFQLALEDSGGGETNFIATSISRAQRSAWRIDT
jgi:hypothetical protein